jgi:membrane protein YdbS with pleckstrin-like domain
VKRRIPLWAVITFRVMLAIAAAVLLVLEILLQIGRYKDPQWLPIAVVAVVATGTLTHHEPDGSISRCD